MGFKNLARYMSTCCEFDVVWQTRSTAWELTLGRIALRTLLYGFLVSSKVNRTQIGAFSLVYIFRSDRLDTLLLFHSVL